jgi:membrane-bound lytic murein transglycosylase B
MKDDINMKKLSLLGIKTSILRRVEDLKVLKTKVLESVKKHVNKEKIISLSKKMSTASLTVKIATFSLVMAAVPASAMQTTVKNDAATKQYNTALKLDLNSQTILSRNENKPVIQVGESEYDKKEREAREAAEANREVVTRESTATRTEESATSTDINNISNTNTSYDPDLATKRALVQKAASRYSIDWKILEAVWQVESGKAWITPVTSYAGAQGPMQFMPGTWIAYAVDGNGDGFADINNAEDAVYAAANLLAQAGAAAGDVDSALFSYNHAQWYVDMVKGIANSI